IAARQTPLAVAATLGQPVRGRAHLPSDCGPAAVLGAAGAFGSVGDLPHPRHHAAGVHLHDADGRLLEHVARNFAVTVHDLHREDHTWNPSSAFPPSPQVSWSAEAPWVRP